MAVNVAKLVTSFITVVIGLIFTPIVADYTYAASRVQTAFAWNWNILIFKKPTENCT